MSEVQKANEEAVRKYLDGDLTEEALANLTEDQIALAVEMADNGSFDTIENEAPPVEPTPPKDPEPPKIEEAVDGSNIIPIGENEKMRDALATANTEKQLRENRDKELQRLKDDPAYRNKYFGIEASNTIDPDKDYLADEHLRKIDSQGDEINELLQWKTDREAKDAATDAKTKTKNEQLGLFGEIQQIQEDFPTLKTSESFQEIDTKFIKWQNKAMGAGVDTDKYLADEAYKTMVDGKGYKLDVSTKDMNVASKLYKINSQYIKEKKANYNTSFNTALKNSGMYEGLMEAKFGGHNLANDDAINKAIAENSQEPQIMNTGGAPTVTSDIEGIVQEMTMLSTKTHLSPEDNKRLHELDKIYQTFL